MSGAQQNRALMMILRSHKTLSACVYNNMMLSQCPVSCASKISQVLSSVQSLYFNHRIFVLLVSALFTCLAIIFSARSFALPKKMFFSFTRAFFRWCDVICLHRRGGGWGDQWSPQSLGGGPGPGCRYHVYACHL